MKYNGIIEKKLELLERKLSEIEDWNIKTFTEFKQSSLLQNAVERALQVAIEIVIDISERILALEHIGPAEYAADAVKKLNSIGVLKSYEEYQEMIRFRNFIVHRYEYIDADILFSIVTQKLHLFRSFIDEIRQA